jgi:hypothetical protein
MAALPTSEDFIYPAVEPPKMLIVVCNIEITHIRLRLYLAALIFINQPMDIAVNTLSRMVSEILDRFNKPSELIGRALLDQAVNLLLKCLKVARRKLLFEKIDKKRGEFLPRSIDKGRPWRVLDDPFEHPDHIAVKEEEFFAAAFLAKHFEIREERARAVQLCVLRQARLMPYPMTSKMRFDGSIDMFL